VAVGLLFGLGDRFQPPRVDDHDPSDVRLDDPRDRQRVPGRLQRNPIGGRELRREALQLFGPGGHSRGAADLAGLPDHDLAEVAVHVQPDAASQHWLLISLAVDGVSRRRRAHDTDGFVLEAHPGKS
jgi:hypothetical protein